MVRKLFLNALILSTSLILLSSCKQNDNLSYYYGNTTYGAGSGGGSNGCGCGCCGCCNSNSTTSTCDPTITVIDEKEDPIPNATVAIYGNGMKTYTTDDNGQVALTSIANGSYTIKATATGYNEVDDSFTVSEKACPSALLTMPIIPTCNATFTVELDGCPQSSGLWPGAIVTIDGTEHVAD